MCTPYSVPNNDAFGEGRRPIVKCCRFSNHAYSSPAKLLRAELSSPPSYISTLQHFTTGKSLTYIYSLEGLSSGKGTHSPLFQLAFSF